MPNGIVSGDQFPADYGFTLPNMFPSVGETLQNISAKKERDKMFDFEKAKFNDQLQQRDEAKRTQLLNQKTDALKYHTGLQVFDDWADKKAGDLLEKYSTDPNITNLPPAQFAAQLNQDWLPIIQGYGAVKNKLTAENNSINQVTAQNKWIDKDQLTRDVYNQVASEYMQPDQNGDVTFKPTDRVDYNKDFTQELLASPDAYKYANDNAIGDFYKNITQPKEENRSYILNNPDNSTSVFEGKLSPFETENVVPNDKGFVNKAPTYSIANEGRTDAIGNPINSLPVDTMNNYMLNSAGNKMAFQKLYNEYADKTGVDKNSQLEQQKFGYTLIKNLRNNQPSLHSYTRPPKISTNINLPKDTNINDVYGEINSKGANVPDNGFIPFNELSNTAQQVLAKGLIGEDDKNLGVKNLAVSKDKDGNWVLSNVQTNDDGSVQKIKDLYKITYSGINLPANTSQKQKQIILHNQQKDNHSNADADPLGILK